MSDQQPEVEPGVENIEVTPLPEPDEPEAALLDPDDTYTEGPAEEAGR